MKTNHSILIALLLLFTSSLRAQVRDSRFFWNSSLVSGIAFQTWNTDSDRISQLSIPVIYVWPVNHKLSFDVSAGLAFASRTIASNNLDGLKDTRLRATYLTMRERLLLTAFLTFPTGISRLEGDQNETASALSDDALDFRVPNFGQGYRLNLGGVYAQEISNQVVLGGGLAFLLKGAFKPFEDSELEYRPGNELALTFGIDIGGNTFKMTGDASYMFYQADRANDEEVFRSGNKLLLQLRWILNPQPFGMTVYLQHRSKGKNERRVGFQTVESLTEELLNANGNRLDVGSVSSYALSDGTTLRGLIGMKIYSKNEFGDRGATILGVGGGLQQRVSRKFSFEASLRFSKGRLESRSSSTSVTGLEVGGAIRYQL